jgi:hypothetical protein
MLDLKKRCTPGIKRQVRGSTRRRRWHLSRGQPAESTTQGTSPPTPMLVPWGILGRTALGGKRLLYAPPLAPLPPPAAVLTPRRVVLSVRGRLRRRNGPKPKRATNAAGRVLCLTPHYPLSLKLPGDWRRRSGQPQKKSRVHVDFHCHWLKQWRKQDYFACGSREP